MEQIVAVLVASVTALVAVVAQFILSRRASRDVSVEFRSREKDILATVQAAATENTSNKGITWDDLANGTVQDHELRGIVDTLAQRLARLETVSERIQVRRQALLETYHNQGLSQSRISFAFSLLLGLLGFGVIVYAVLSKDAGVATYLSGAITEAVAALFFTQSNQARVLMARFFDKLRDDRRLEESLSLADGILDPKLRASLQALLSMHLIGSEHSPSLLPGFNSDGVDQDIAPASRELPTTKPDGSVA